MEIVLMLRRAVRIFILDHDHTRIFEGCIVLKPLYFFSNLASCGGDPNAQSGCGNPCGKTCASLNANLTNVGCPQYCEVNGCDCKDGYRLNTDTKKCTLIKDCPKRK